MVLIEDGRVVEESLRRELITVAELEAAVRRQGIERLDQVKLGRLESTGALTFIAKQPTDEERRHREVVERLDAFGRRDEQLLARLEALERRLGSRGAD